MELVKGVEAVPGRPMIYLRTHRLLAFADLHLGLEESLAATGVFIPRAQYRKIVREVEEVLGEYNVETLVINGDLKHSFSRLTWQEREEVRGLLKTVRRHVGSIIVVRGNHDNFLPTVLREFNAEFIEEYPVGDYVFVHGHRSIDPNRMRGRVIIIGHEHPSVTLRDSIGYVAKFPCFLVGPLKTDSTILVLPAMSIYASGTSVTTDRLQYLSPIVREHGVVEEFKPYIFDEEVGVLELPRLIDLEELPNSMSG